MIRYEDRQAQAWSSVGRPLDSPDNVLNRKLTFNADLLAKSNVKVLRAKMQIF